jgi:hypothetical protein
MAHMLASQRLLSKRIVPLSHRACELKLKLYRSGTRLNVLTKKRISSIGSSLHPKNFLDHFRVPE